MFNTPILIITFNRAEHVRRVLGEVRKQQPSKLYIFQDGAREDRSDDVEKCKAVRDVVNELVDWPCELHTNYQEKNLGCGPGPYTAISWFFENEEYGIILEDDILPHPLFFRYMDEMLVRYKDDNRIGMVTGHNLQRRYCGNKSYYFTFAMEGTLGWGTWRRVWKDFDFNIQFDREKLNESYRNNYHFPLPLRRKECNFYQRFVKKERHDCWDFQFDYYLLENGYLNARANSCLTSHEGDDCDATHSGYYNPNYKMSVNESRFRELIHPKVVKIHNKEKCRMYWRALKHIIRNKWNCL